MDAGELTAITSFICSGAALFASGYLFHQAASRASALGSWRLMLLFLGLGMLLSGIDHGFFEPRGPTRARLIAVKASWLCACAVGYFLLMSVVRQYAAPAAQGFFAVAGIAQAAVFGVLVLRGRSFVVVSLNLLPAAMACLVLNLLWVGSGMGSWPLVAAILLLVTGALVQGFSVDFLDPLNNEGLSHLIMLAAIVLLGIGGARLKS